MFFIFFIAKAIQKLKKLIQTTFVFSFRPFFRKTVRNLELFLIKVLWEGGGESNFLKYGMKKSKHFYYTSEKKKHHILVKSIASSLHLDSNSTQYLRVKTVSNKILLSKKFQIAENLISCKKFVYSYNL